MVYLNLLDKALNQVYKKQLFILYGEASADFTKVENEYLDQALRRLEADGYVFSTTNYNYRLSFDGLLALNERFLFLFKNRPYKRKQFKAGVMNFWLFIKVVALVFNAVILLWLAILTFLFKD